ncbi:hypothetical protein AB1Y20_004184 [Prymnesium parvum]|uniref:PSI-J n=1 Tax=Prymnesium parvum TaxID=97485 RepID=A0AB34J6Q2_PRYPA
MACQLLALATAWTAPRLPLPHVHARIAPNGASPPVLMQFRFPWDAPAPPAAPAPPPEPSIPMSSSLSEALAFKDATTLSKEEERKLKLEIGTNWPPRTSTVPGQGYQFFQGPTPKTSFQEDLPDFFSKENLSINIEEIGLVPKVAVGVTAALTLWLLVTLLIA